MDRERELFLTADRIVVQNVRVCVSTLVFDLREDEDSFELYEAPIVPDDWIEAAADEGVEIIYDIDEEGWLWEGAGESYNTEAGAAKACCDELGVEPNRREIYEHWVVTDWLASKLEAQDELIVRDWHGLTLWGRATTGQAIVMDYVIQEIAKDIS